MVPEYPSAEDPAAAFAAIPDEVILRSSLERPALFSVLVDRYSAPFLRLARRVVGGREDAEDVVQEAFLKIYRYGRGFRRGQDRKFSSWAYKIVLNTAITHYHRLRRREWLLPEDGSDPTAGEAHARFREATLDRETQGVVRGVLAMMPQDLKTLITAYYLEDRPYRDIAAREDMTTGALKMKLFRARKLFRRFLTGGPAQ